MLDLHAPVLDPAQGERLDRPAYKRDFWDRDARIQGSDSWKLERRQHFEEQNLPSREALRRGDWAEALRLQQESRDSLLQTAQEDERRGSIFRRVRLVEKPLTPYMQWELHGLRLQAECGWHVRILGAETVSTLERTRLLPEVVILGSEVLYNVLYTAGGATEGAIRFTDPDLIAAWENFTKSLYADGEDVISYVDREVAHLPPPVLKPA